MTYDSIGDQNTFLPGATPRAPALTPGTVIGGRFEVVRLLGRGGMGEVHLCRHLKLNREVAVKRLLSEGALHDTALERFRREAQSVAQLSHANIVTLYDYDVDETGPYLVMELLHGEDLTAHVRGKGPLPSEEVRRIGLQLIDALEYAHARQIIHRDIKPSNVFVQVGGQIKVLDFGLARSAGDASLSIIGGGLGTADYVAPEQADDATKADTRSDQFSLGATLYFLLTGKSPRVVRERDIPEVWRELVLRMLEQEPGERYGNLGEVRAELQELALGDRKPPVAASVIAVPTAPAVVQPKPVVASDVSSWAEVLKASVDRSIVTDARLADQITAVGLPWRVYDRVTGIEMVLIPPGSFWKGALPDDAEAFDNEWPFHKVTITRAFYLAVYPVKQSEWTRLMGFNPSDFPGALRPVENVSWDDAMAFCLKSGGSLRLPTEAEWEYACRAGTPASRYGNLDDIAWYDTNSARKSQDVGGLRANPFGLHDMLGNVWEWCSDWYGAYSSQAQVNPQGPNKGQSRVYRGGAWDVNFRRCRASRRDHYAPNVTRNSIGFRVARTT